MGAKFPANVRGRRAIARERLRADRQICANVFDRWVESEVLLVTKEENGVRGALQRFMVSISSFVSTRSPDNHSDHDGRTYWNDYAAPWAVENCSHHYADRHYYDPHSD
jgi:hypothetical protein